MLFGATLCLAGLASGKPWWIRGVESNESDFLPPDVAFRVGSRVDGNVVRVRWVIADGYYLYRHKIELQSASPGLLLSAMSFPKGIIKTDQYLGTQEIFVQEVEGTAAFSRSDAGAHPIEIKVTYQGCAEAGLCYPPISKVLLPDSTAHPMARSRSHAWVAVATIGGGIAYLMAGLLLRKGRRLETPAY